MNKFNRWPRVKPWRFTSLFAPLMAPVIVGLFLPQPFHLVLLTSAVVGLFVPTTASYNRNGAS